MKGETGDRRPAIIAAYRTRAAGFTLLEILLVLTLMGLIMAMVIAGVTRVFSSDHPPPEDVFWQACRSAQKMASLSDQNVTFSFDAQTNRLVWTNGAETEDATFDPADGKVGIQFLQAQQGGSLILIAGQVVETQEVPHVTFYPDGTCSAFRVQFRVGKNTWQVAIDPWTCAPMLQKAKEAGS